jgi:hypothetical protein
MIALTIISILLVLGIIEYIVVVYYGGWNRTEAPTPAHPNVELSDEQRFAILAKYQAIIESK